MSVRKSKWHPPPPPTPRILHLPRRTRRSKTAKTPAGKPLSSREQQPEYRRDRRGKLEALFDQERVFSRSVPVVLLNTDESERRDRVEDGKSGRDGLEDENWKFQAEILRAECNFLRMEREIALKKLERNRLQMERTLQSAVKTLVLGRKKIFEGKNLGILLEQEIEYLVEKLEELQKSSGFRDFELRECGNFDRQASVLRRKLEKIEQVSEETKCVREIREMAEASLKIESCNRFDKVSGSDRKSRFATDVETVRRKMELLSRGMLERMEEYGFSVLSSGSNSSSAASSKRMEIPEMGKRQQEVCSGRCKGIVRKIVEHVRAETEQWSQMQGMLGQVRDEMEELQASRDFWEDRALESDDRLQTLQSEMLEWKQKALSSENKVSELEKQISELQTELERLRTKPVDLSSPKAPPDIRSVEPIRTSGSQRLMDALKEKEKRVLICRLKENSYSSKKYTDRDDNRRGYNWGSNPKRPPLQEIGNSSPLLRQSRAVFPLFSPDSSN
ncbi:hypothetical protein AAC387_Pa02g1076 [Persea americana]